MRHFGESEKESILTALRPICSILVIAFYFSLFCSAAFKTGFNDFLNFFKLSGFDIFSADGKKAFSIDKLSIMNAEMLLYVMLALSLTILISFIVFLYSEDSEEPFFYGTESELYTHAFCAESAYGISRADFFGVPFEDRVYTGIIKSNN